MASERLRGSRVAAAALFAWIALAAGTASAGDSYLRWTHPNPGAVSTFRVYARPASANDFVLVDGNVGVPATDIVGAHWHEVTVPDGTVEVAITAVDSDGDESPLSNAVFIQTGGSAAPQPLGVPGKPYLIAP